jgi:hypothetical protein
MGVLQRCVRREKGFRDASAIIHNIQAVSTTQVTHEEKAVPNQLGNLKKPGRKKGFNTVHRRKCLSEAKINFREGESKDFILPWKSLTKGEILGRLVPVRWHVCSRWNS